MFYKPVESTLKFHSLLNCLETDSILITRFSALLIAEKAICSNGLRIYFTALSDVNVYAID